ncbi:MAG: hypothetical protein R3E96_08435 [Planctomycetota bacterium]
MFDAGYGQAGFYCMVPRNATLALVFADLVDANKINAQNVHVYTGDLALAPFDARIIPDSLYGDALDFDGDGQMEFHTNRVLVDFTTNTFSRSPRTRPCRCARKACRPRSIRTVTTCRSGSRP